MKKDKVLSYLGIAKKAGFVKSGTFQTEEAIKSGKAKLVIMSDDASENTSKKFENMSANYNVPFRKYSDSDDLGHSIGSEFRMCLAVTDEGLAKAMLKCIDLETE